MEIESLKSAASLQSNPDYDHTMMMSIKHKNYTIKPFSLLLFYILIALLVIIH